MTPLPQGPARRPSPRRGRAALLALVLAALALGGCSSGDDGGASEAAPAADGAVRAGEDPGVDTADVAADGTASGQQVVQTAHVTMLAPDPVAAGHAVVALVERVDGRVDARSERSGDDAGDPGSAELTVRVPASAMSTIADDLREIGDVRDFQLETEDVTGAAQDLDARVAATELSVARMSDLLARATTNADVISAEKALTERQATLEQLRAERARLADRVALSTVSLVVYAPDAAPEQTAPATFLDGLGTGWSSFTAAVRGALVVLGVLLPWALAGGVVVALVLAWQRRRRAPAAGTAGAPTPGTPAPAAPGAAPAAGPVPPARDRP
ncbi:DUF4349 domain-containing protein [Cellulomonas iranensis]|uniref:DUF4349 domain-containing protein n=1 Tax=Cellulomonas iranensis TaxID=76862 RepID=UPI001CF4CC57|nr:DUF4349 domain-containing protein [Cellulomonas iranensis]UCN15852.1 DUF4349 domain-containing protein [Cellulomonas iranensis]